MPLQKLTAVTNLMRWYALGNGNKDKLYRGIRKKTIYCKNINPSRSKVKTYCYYPNKKPIGAYLLTPGLHPLGAKHPQMQDFAMMLCSLGYIVYSPHISDYAKLYIVPETPDDYLSVFDEFTQDPLLPEEAKKIHVFSISFGSLLSLKLASNKERSKKVASKVIIFRRLWFLAFYL